MAAALPAPIQAPPPRGRMVDIGGRALRAVIEGERGDGPLLICEAGAFGSAADWAAVQPTLSSRARVLSYDRAGLGYSDPGPDPRDSLAIADDLRALLDALGEKPPYILIGHSMAAVHLQVFALRWPAEVAGVVLLDAIPAEALARPTVRRFVAGARRMGDLARTGSRFLLTALSAPFFGDGIGLSGEPHGEKLRAFASPQHNYWSAKELDCWLTDGAQASALGEFDREMPLAVVTAGRSQGWWKRMQSEPARRSRSGYAENITRAGHASLLGPKHCDAVVRAVEFILRGALARR